MSVYLLDLDACGLLRLAGAGVFDDVESAAASWRDQVGVSAEGVTPAAATPESLTCLVYYEHEEQNVIGDESRTVEWLEGMLPGTEHSVSPHGSEYFRELIGDWLDDPVTDAVRTLLPEWVRWNGEQAGVPAAWIERAVSAGSASA